MQISYFNYNLFLFYSYLLDVGKQRLLCWRWRSIRRRRKTEKKKEGNIRRRRISFYVKEKKNKEGKGGKYLEMICPKIIKSIEMSRFWSRSWDFCQFLKGFGIGFGEFSLEKKSLGFGFREFGLRKSFSFRKFGLRKKVSVLVSENLVSENKFQYRFHSKFCYRHSMVIPLRLLWPLAALRC